MIDARGLQSIDDSRVSTRELALPREAMTMITSEVARTVVQRRSDSPVGELSSCLLSSESRPMADSYIAGRSVINRTQQLIVGSQRDVTNITGLELAERWNRRLAN